jgi:hypothetical protein
MSLAGQLFAQEEGKSRGTPGAGKDCLCVLQIPDLNTAALDARGDDQSRNPLGLIIGAIAPIIVEEIVKAVRSRSEVSASARNVTIQQLTAARGGERGIDEESVRGLFGGSISAPGIKIGVVVG